MNSIKTHLRRLTTIKRVKNIRDIKGDDPATQIPSSFSAPSPTPGKAIAYCTAEQYDFKPLYQLLKKEYSLFPYMADDVLHINLKEIKSSATEVFQASENDPQAFIFQNGTFVTWGASDTQVKTLLRQVKSVQINDFPVEQEWFDYYVDPSQTGGISTDTIILGQDLALNESMFVFSAGSSC